MVLVRKPMARFRAVLSDIDGTLTDSEDLHRDAFIKINGDLGVTFTNEELSGGTGVALIDLYDGLKARFDQPISYQDWADRLAAYYVLHADQVRILPGARDFLMRADQGGMAIAAVTNAQPSEAAVNIGQFGDQADLFRFTITVDDVARPKPAPDSYLEGARRLGIPPVDIVVLEDSPVGVKAAKAAGMTVIQIQPDPALINDKADLVVRRLDDPMVTAYMGLPPDLRSTPPRMTG